MTYVINKRIETVVQKRETIPVLRQLKGGSNGNVNSHNVTLDQTPDGDLPLFLAYQAEDNTTEVTSISQTGATWSRVYRDTTHGDGIELWSTPGATGTAITVTMSGTQWSQVGVIELVNASDRIVGQNTVAGGTNPVSIDTVPGNGGVFVQARRAGAGGFAVTCAPVGAKAAVRTVVSQNNSGMFFVSPRPPSLSVGMPTTTDPGVSVATIERP